MWRVGELNKASSSIHIDKQQNNHTQNNVNLSDEDIRRINKALEDEY